ncbi:potassium transporter Kup [Salinispira pacifica]
MSGNGDDSEAKGNNNDKQPEQSISLRRMLILSLTALGVVYGDIGTSPLYAFKICFVGAHGIAPDSANILGVLSMIFWALVIVISIKYLAVILRADNQGEGGILALMELVLPRKRGKGAVVLILGLFGAALLYGDGTITPAISVLSAVEGLRVATSALDPYILPIALVILFLLFLLQQVGTSRVGTLFGPVMLVWFPVLALLGVLQILKNPAVLSAVNPLYAVRFFQAHGVAAAFIVGAVFLVVTGGEALYADIGHFGRAPIRTAWYSVVLPCLLLNYFGQGALLLAHPEHADNPFYHLAPGWALYPMVVLATAATIIASQAIISGVFSLSFQAQQLGYLPRMRVRHTSEEQRGQILMPQVNWLLFVATAVVVLSFRTSDSLSGAYGLAVSTTMVITTLLAYRAFHRLWGWHPVAAGAVAALFLIVDVAFLAANAVKITEGGWYPLSAGLIIYLCMSTWARGTEIVGRQIGRKMAPVDEYVDDLDFRTVKRVPGMAIYLARGLPATPLAFVYNTTHNKIVHRQVIFLTVSTDPRPHVRSENRIEFEKLSSGFSIVRMHFGFMDSPNVPAALRIVSNNHLKIDSDEVTYFVGRESLVASRTHGMSLWRDMLYLFMLRNSERIVNLFSLPDDQVVEIGGRIRL